MSGEKDTQREKKASEYSQDETEIDADQDGNENKWEEKDQKCTQVDTGEEGEQREGGMKPCGNDCSGR